MQTVKLNKPKKGEFLVPAVYSPSMWEETIRAKEIQNYLKDFRLLQMKFSNAI